MLVNFMAVCSHFVYFVYFCIFYIWPRGIFLVILVYFARFGMLRQEKSGNPALRAPYPSDCNVTTDNDLEDVNNFAQKYFTGAEWRKRKKREWSTAG
jgi:hypothetical protein